MGNIMSPVLKFGVLDVPYTAQGFKDAGVRKPKGGMTDNITVGDVAEILEAKYGIMEFFWDENSDRIGQVLLDAVEGAAESAAMGAPATADPYAQGLSEIESMFRDMLTRRELDGRVDGVPTMAAQEGHSKRFKRPHKRRKERPSFVDTGLYQGGFRAWVDDK